jgi:hypothetical protein
MDTDAGNESDFKAIGEPIAHTEDVPMNNNVVEDVKPIDNNEGGVDVQDASNTASSANGGVSEERTMSKREQKRALKRKVEQRRSTSQSRQDAKPFLQSSELGPPPPPHPQASLSPPMVQGGGAHSLGGEGRGGFPIPTSGQTLWYCRNIQYVLSGPGNM